MGYINANEISRFLLNNIDNIKKYFGLFGVHVTIDKKNILKNGFSFNVNSYDERSFYIVNSNLILISNNIFKIEIEYNKKNITYYQSKNHIKISESSPVERIGYTIESIDDNKLEITLFNEDDEIFNFYKMSMSDNSLIIVKKNTLTNACKKVVYLTDSNFLSVLDGENDKEGHILTCNNTELIIDNQRSASSILEGNYSILPNKIISHPRVKAIILNTLNELDNYMGGLKDFIIDNCALYNEIMGKTITGYDPVIEGIVSLVIPDYSKRKVLKN